MAKQSTRAVDAKTDEVQDEMHLEVVTDNSEKSVESPPDGLSADALPEVSPALQAHLQKQTESASDASEDAEEDNASSNQVTKTEVITKAEQLERAELAAMGAVMTVGTVAAQFGFDLGIDEEKGIEFAKGVAPCMVKYGVLPGGNGGKYQEEIKAAVAIFMLGAGIKASLDLQRETKRKQAEEEVNQGRAQHGH